MRLAFCSLPNGAVGSVNDGVSSLHVLGFIIDESSSPPGGQTDFQFTPLNFNRINMIVMRIDSYDICLYVYESFVFQR